jgi:hypothetical protein
MQQSIEDLIVVSDMQEIVYRNKYCAKCNGVNTSVSWKLIFKCKTTKHLIEFQPEDALETLRDCMIWSVPPLPGMGKSSQCFKAYDSCNITGQLPNHPAMQYHHESMQRVCKAYTLYYFDTTQIGTRSALTVFQNVHCFFCNFFQRILQEFCPYPELKYSDFNKINHAVAMLNQTLYETLKRQQEQAKDDDCDRSQVYDPLFVS